MQKSSERQCPLLCYSTSFRKLIPYRCELNPLTLSDPSTLQDEIRKLEREFNTLSHKSVSISASCQRDHDEAENLRGEVLRLESEVREWEARDAKTVSSLVALQASGQLLAEMEVQARTRLDEEVKRTRDQRAQMEGSIIRAKLQAKEVEERKMKVEAYAQMKDLEEKMRKGRRELEMRRHQGGSTGSRQALLREDKRIWELFKTCVVDAAKARKDTELASKVVEEEAKALEGLNVNIARFRSEQTRRRAELEQEGRARLEKVSVEVDRIERVVAEKNDASLEGSLGGSRGFMAGGADMMKGRVVVEQMDENSRGQSQDGSGSNFFSISTSPANYAPPTPR